MDQQKTNPPTKYEILENPNNKYGPFCPVRIIDGPYAGMLVSFGRVQFSEPNENGAVMMRFEHTILENPTDSAALEDNDARLLTTLGDVIVDILDHQLETSVS
jgi:hypothetical protein